MIETQTIRVGVCEVLDHNEDEYGIVFVFRCPECNEQLGLQRNRDVVCKCRFTWEIDLKAVGTRETPCTGSAPNGVTVTHRVIG